MKRIIEIAQQFADGLITAAEFRNRFAVCLMNLDDEADLFLLCILLLQPESSNQ